jgi:deazaflavin-dependent oxidoreductase (nitroreductase family)
VSVTKLQLIGLNIHQWLYEKTGGRFGQSLGKLKALLLYTTGAKTGIERCSALVYATDGDHRFLVVGSNGGNEKTPGWVANARKQPNVEIQIGRDRRKATAAIVLPDDADYERLWAIVNETNRYKDGGRYAHYQTLTSRPIPVVVLTDA